MNVIHLSAEDFQVSLYTSCPTKGRMGAHGTIMLRAEALSNILQETLWACGVRSLRCHASTSHLRPRTPQNFAAARERPSTDAVVLTPHASGTLPQPFRRILQSPQSIRCHQ